MTKQKKIKHISDLGLTPELFELMAANAQPNDSARFEKNKKAIKRELRAKRKKKNLLKGLR